MIPGKFEYFAPTSLEEALRLLSAYPEDAKLLAGGQSLLSILKLRLANPAYLIDLGRIPGLSYIREAGRDRIAIGALTTYAEMKESELLRSQCPLLPQTTAVVGDVQVRNRGTLGGSLAHADPAGDLPAAILALRAELKAVSPKGERWIQAKDFFLGMMTTALSSDEILTEIRVPVLSGWKSAYLKAARRPSDFAVAGVAVCLKVDQNQVCEDISIGVTGVTDKPYLAEAVEIKLKGKKLEPKVIEDAASAVTQDVYVMGNIHGSQDYRSHLARVYTLRAIQSAR